MATSMRRRGVAVTAFALTSGTSLPTFGTAAPAGASSTHAPAYYQDVTSPNVLTANLRQQLNDSSLPPIAARALARIDVGNLTANALTGVNSSSSVLTNGSVAMLDQLLKLKRVDVIGQFQ